MDNAWRIYRCCLLALALCSLTAAHAADTPVPSVPDTPVPSVPDTPNYVHSPLMTCLLHWLRFPVSVYFSVTPYSTADRQALALSGFDEWTHATSGVMCYQIVKDQRQADITVNIVASVEGPKEARALGKTTLIYRDMTLHKAVIQVAVCDDAPAEFQEVCAHEFGHALGINGHSDDPGDMMYLVLIHPLFPADNSDLDTLCAPLTVTIRDLNTLKAAYPALTFPSKNH